MSTENPAIALHKETKRYIKKKKIKIVLLKLELSHYKAKRERITPQNFLASFAVLKKVLQC